MIVVDDGSSDCSRTVINGYADRVKTLFKANGGQGSAYNAGFALSRGDLLLFLDSDDFLSPEAISESVSVWTPEVSKIHFKLLLADGSGQAVDQPAVPSAALPQGDLKPTIIRTGTYVSSPGSGNLYSRKALSAIMPMPEAPWVHGADCYTITLAPLFGEVRATKKPLGFYRVHGSNHSQRSITGDFLNSKLKREKDRDQLLFETLNGLGFEYSAGTVEKDISHYKLRLASLRVNGTKHIYKKDSLAKVAIDTARLAMADRTYSVRKKLLFLAWAGAVIFAPRRHLSPLLNVGFNVISRSKKMHLA